MIRSETTTAALEEALARPLDSAARSAQSHLCCDWICKSANTNSLCLCIRVIFANMVKPGKHCLVDFMRTGRSLMIDCLAYGVDTDAAVHRHLLHSAVYEDVCKLRIRGATSRSNNMKI